MLNIKSYFKLEDSFIKGYEGTQPDWGPVGYFVYKRTYSRNLSCGRSEEYWETVRRVVEGCYTVQWNHCLNLRLPWNKKKAQKSAQEMFRLLWDFKFLPPGRGLWMMGTDYVYERGGAGLNNCGFVSTMDLSNDNFSDPFCFLMDLSMLGVGVAFDTKGDGLVSISKPKISSHTHRVADSKEGWVEIVRIVLDSYVGKERPFAVDFSEIRPEGSPINTFGGIAPGANPLKECLNNIDSVLVPLIGKNISSSTIVDLMNIIGKCVVSGGVRRTAELALGSPFDSEYLSLKDPDANNDKLMNWRWASNNSVICDVGMNYSEVGDQASKNGEPGFFWLDNARNFGRLADGFDDKDQKVLGTNPCSEQSLESYELCNLVETFPSRHDSIEQYKRTLKFAYLYAKTVTLIPTHIEKTNAIMLRNRRIGLSQSGIVESFSKIGKRNHFNWCDEGYKYVSSLDRKYSQWLCIPESIKRTSVKPSGTVSLLPGVTPGIHYPHSEYYYRTIRIDKTSPLVSSIREAGYRVEDSSYGDNTLVIYFPIREKYFSKCKKDVSVWEQVENVAQMQYFWADNQVSVTITFNKDEKKDISSILELYENRLKSISFLPLSEHSYVQAPYQEITKEEYDEYVSTIKPIVFHDKKTNEILDLYCDGEKCLI